jgi:hypothetical protein
VDWSCPILGATRLPYIDTHRDAPTEQNEGGFFDFFDGGGAIEKSRMDTNGREELFIICRFNKNT